MADVYFDTFLEADVALEFDYSDDEFLGVAITINHPIGDDGKEFNLEVVGYWKASDIDLAIAKYTNMKKAFVKRTNDFYSEIELKFGSIIDIMKYQI